MFSNNILSSVQLSHRRVINGAMGLVRAGPAARRVLSPVPLCLTPSAASLSSSARRTGGALRGLRTLCAHPQRTNTIKAPQCAPLPIPRVQAVPAPVTGERRAKQLLPVDPASATTVISWNKARMQPHVLTDCSVTLQPLSFPSHFYIYLILFWHL